MPPIDKKKALRVGCGYFSLLGALFMIVRACALWWISLDTFTQDALLSIGAVLGYVSLIVILLAIGTFLLGGFNEEEE